MLISRRSNSRKDQTRHNLTGNGINYQEAACNRAVSFFTPPNYFVGMRKNLPDISFVLQTEAISKTYLYDADLSLVFDEQPKSVPAQISNANENQSRAM